LFNQIEWENGMYARTCKSLMILSLMAFFSSACSWVAGVREEERINETESRLTGCSSKSPMADTVIAIITGMAGGLMVGLVDTSPDQSDPNDTCIMCGFGDAITNGVQYIGGLTLLGTSMGYTIAAGTGWASYSNCRDELAASDQASDPDRPAYLPDTRRRFSSCNSPAPPPPLNSPSVFAIRW
jgi:hypothetical protein